MNKKGVGKSENLEGGRGILKEKVLFLYRQKLGEGDCPPALPVPTALYLSYLYHLNNRHDKHSTLVQYFVKKTTLKLILKEVERNVNVLKNLD